MLKQALVVQSDVRPTTDQEMSDPCWVLQHSFMEIDYETFSRVILPSAASSSCQFLAKECAQVLFNYLED